jgi:hypothetical protein
MARIPPPQTGEGKKRIKIPKVETDSKGVHWVLIGKKRIRLKGKMTERELIKFIITKLVRRRRARKASAPEKTGLKGTAEWKDPNPAFSKVGVDDQAVASYYNALRKQIEAPKPADSQHVTKEDVRQLLEDKRLKLLYQPSEDYLGSNLGLEHIPRSAQSMPPLDRYEHKRSPGTAIRVKPEKFETPKRASFLKTSRPPSSAKPAVSSSKPAGSLAGSAGSTVTKKPVSARKTRTATDNLVIKKLAEEIPTAKLKELLPKAFARLPKHLQHKGTYDLNLNKTPEQQVAYLISLNDPEIMTLKKHAEERVLKGSGLNNKDGLNSDEIDTLMARYSDYLGTIPSDGIQKYILPKVRKGQKAAFVINTDPERKSGQHWTALYIDPTDRSLWSTLTLSLNPFLLIS